MYLVFLLLVWLCIRVVRRLNVHGRQEDLLHEVRLRELAAGRRAEER